MNERQRVVLLLGVATVMALCALFLLSRLG